MFASSTASAYGKSMHCLFQYITTTCRQNKSWLAHSHAGRANQTKPSHGHSLYAPLLSETTEQVPRSARREPSLRHPSCPPFGMNYPPCWPQLTNQLAACMHAKPQIRSLGHVNALTRSARHGRHCGVACVTAHVTIRTAVRRTCRIPVSSSHSCIATPWAPGCRMWGMHPAQARQASGACTRQRVAQQAAQPHCQQLARSAVSGLPEAAATH